MKTITKSFLATAVCIKCQTSKESKRINNILESLGFDNKHAYFKLPVTYYTCYVTGNTNWGKYPMCKEIIDSEELQPQQQTT